MTVLDNDSVVYASVNLLLAAPGRMPDEGLLRAVIGPAMQKIKAAIDAFEDELQKLKAWQKIVNDHLSAAYRSGMTADALFESYTSSPAFAEDRLVVSSDISRAFFPAYNYARQRCNEMCAPGDNPSGDETRN